MDYLFCHKGGIDRSSVAQSVFTSGLDAFMIEEIIKHKLLVSLLKCNKETSRRAHEGSNIFDQIWMWKSILSSLRNNALTRGENVSVEGGRTFVIKWFRIKEESAQSTTYWFQITGLSIRGFVDDWWCLSLIREVIHQGFIFQDFRCLWHKTPIHF